MDIRGSAISDQPDSLSVFSSIPQRLLEHPRGRKPPYCIPLWALFARAFFTRASPRGGEESELEHQDPFWSASPLESSTFPCTTFSVTCLFCQVHATRPHTNTTSPQISHGEM